MAPRQLEMILERLNGGEKPTATPRELMSWFGAFRRTWGNVEKIRAGLTELNITTVPDFTEVWVDATIEFKRLVEPVAYAGRGDPTHRIRRLRAANNQPISVKPNTPLQEAVMLMIENDYSQLPVMTTDREVKGIITYRGIAERFALGKQGTEVREFMDEYFDIPQERSVLQAVKDVIDHECILIRADDGRITGIMTATDLAYEFYNLGEPFILLGEIENQIRNLLHDKYTREELESAKNQADTEREITDLASMTFGEYINLLGKVELWEKSQIPAERTCFINELSKVRDIRNDVMHFDPDGISEDELHILRRFVRYLRRIREITQQ